MTEGGFNLRLRLWMIVGFTVTEDIDDRFSVTRITIRVIDREEGEKDEIKREIRKLVRKDRRLEHAGINKTIYD